MVRIRKTNQNQGGKIKISTCTINVGNGEGNRNVVMDVLWFVEVFFTPNCLTNRRDEYLEHENQNYELVSNIKDGDIEVYVRKDMVGWFKVEKHEKEFVVVWYEKEEKVKRIGAIYVRPLRDVGLFEKSLEKVKGYDIIRGNLNARHKR